MPEPAQGSSWLANHFAQLTARLKVYGSTSGHSIQFNATPSESYSEYLKRLQQVKASKSTHILRPNPALHFHIAT